jgi:beta-N-acetylhexosaminidase
MNNFNAFIMFKSILALFLLLPIQFLPVSVKSQINTVKLPEYPCVNPVVSLLTNSSSEEYIKRQIVEAELTLLENKNQLIPFQGLDTLHIAALSIGSGSVTPFQKMLGNYSNIDYFNLSVNYTEAESKVILKKIGRYNLVITGVHSLLNSKDSTLINSLKPDHTTPDSPIGKTANYGNIFQQLTLIRNRVVVFFLNPNTIPEMEELGHQDGLLIAYQDTPLSEQLAAQLLFGGIGAKGKLPVPIGNQYHAGDGLVIPHPIRLKYTLPEEVGLNSTTLNRRIDSIVNNALIQKTFPGCNILVAKDSKVIFQKSYGFHTYEQRVPSTTEDIYDLASVTKVAGALPAIMKLNEEGKYLLDEKFSTYWKDWRKRLFHPSNKSDLTVRELLAHQAGLVPYLPFWKQSMSSSLLSHKWYSADQSEKYNLEVAPGLFLNSKFKKHVYKEIRKSPVETRGKYVYSCLSFIIAPEVITRLAGMKYTSYLDQNFYRPLGASTITYEPSHKFSGDQIVPTEYDSIFRKRLVHGFVHDEASAVMGGISGNAGLFASANDLAKLVQMYVQYGTYGGKQYLKRSTIETFNRVQFPQNNNRRGLGFDKPLIDNQKFDRNNAYPCPGASPQSFGHSGFTGTFFWADPSNGLIYIFLSNRIYPTRQNNKITDLNVRTEILQELYDELNRIEIKN